MKMVGRVVKQICYHSARPARSSHGELANIELAVTIFLRLKIEKPAKSIQLNTPMSKHRPRGGFSHAAKSSGVPPVGNERRAIVADGKGDERRRAIRRQASGKTVGVCKSLQAVGEDAVTTN